MCDQLLVQDPEFVRKPHPCFDKTNSITVYISTYVYRSLKHLIPPSNSGKFNLDCLDSPRLLKALLHRDLQIPQQIIFGVSRMGIQKLFVAFWSADADRDVSK